MKVLLDSGIWWRRFHQLPLAPNLKALLAHPDTEFWLCPVSVEEMLFKWRHKPHHLPAPHPDTWLMESLRGFRLAPVTWAAARLAGLWDWQHGDPVDRLLAAVAKTEDLTLVHTDTVLKDLPGFPQRYFPKAG